MTRILLIALLAGGAVMLRPGGAGRAFSADFGGHVRSSMLRSHRAADIPENMPDRLQCCAPDLRKLMETIPMQT